MSEYKIAQSKPPVFFERFERKDENQHQTHYCPGCGHGVAQKLIAEALGRTGCAGSHHHGQPGRLLGIHLLLFRYRQRAGGARTRAGRGNGSQTRPTRGDGRRLSGRWRPGRDWHGGNHSRRQSRREHHRLFRQQLHLRHDRRPDGSDHAWSARPAPPLPGDAAPTTMAFPIRMAELISTLEAPVYVERVALCDSKHILQARKAVKKALELQKQNAGFTHGGDPLALSNDPEDGADGGAALGWRDSDQAVPARRLPRPQARVRLGGRTTEKRGRTAGHRRPRSQSDR